MIEATQCSNALLLQSPAVCVQVERTPWCDDFISPETNLLLPELIDANRHGFLTINSQPRVNAALSTEPMVGWGNPGGYIFQKVTRDC